MLSARRIKWLRSQGYVSQTDQEISNLALGNRFAYQLCTVLLTIGVVTANFWLLLGMLLIAFLGVVLPRHPFDYIYNYLLANMLKRPQLPKRSMQLKFACLIATIWIAITIYLCFNGFSTAAYVLGGMLILVAATVAITDYCLPSTIYNALFNKNIKRQIS